MQETRRKRAGESGYGFPMDGGCDVTQRVKNNKMNDDTGQN